MGNCFSGNKEEKVSSIPACYLCDKPIFQLKYLKCSQCSNIAHIKCINRRGTDMRTCLECQKGDTLILEQNKSIKKS